MNASSRGMLGILNRGKALVFGPGIEKSFPKAHLLLLARDASPRTQKELRLKASAHRVPIYEVESKAALGEPLGRDGLSAVLVLSKKGAQSLLKKLQKGEQA